MKHPLWRTTILLILLASQTVWADSIYKWVDKEGGVHYSARAPEEDRVEGIIEIRPGVNGSSTPAATGVAESPPPATVINGRPILGYAPAAFARALQAP